MNYHFTFQPYQKSFIRPLKTHYGEWQIREGVIIKLRDQTGKERWGEIAPLPWFGSETLEDALNFCKSLDQIINTSQIFSIPDYLPACQFGFASALSFDDIVKTYHNYSYLLPSGEDALKQWKNIYQTKSNLSDIITFKWKIGIDSLNHELKIWETLMQDFPTTVKLRLDANGGLSLTEAKQWLTVLDTDKRIEFLEQPLPKSEFASMLALSQVYQTPLALDESVCHLSELEQVYLQGWRGIFVIKAAIMGYPQRLLDLLQKYPLDCVFSSVFETDIGRKAVLKLVETLGSQQRALGFGIDDWFIDS